MTDFKVILYGGFGVGKSALTTRLLRKNFEKHSSSTIGASFMVWASPIAQLDVHKRVSFGIWDTAGQERFSSLLPMYLRGSDAIIYCWDYNVPFNVTVANAMRKRAKDESPNCHFYLAMTKIDQHDGLRIKSPAAEDWIIENNDEGYYYTSSFTGKGVDELFLEMGRELVRSPPNKNDYIINLTPTATVNNKCCG